MKSMDQEIKDSRKKISPLMGDLTFIDLNKKDVKKRKKR